MASDFIRARCDTIRTVSGHRDTGFLYPDHSQSVDSARSPLRTAMVVVASLTVVVALAVIAYFYMPAVGHPSSKALNYSLSREVGASVRRVDSCGRRSDH